MDTLFLLLFGHALGDFGLQSDSLIQHKKRANNPSSWYIYLGAHAVIHGGLVGFFTGSFLLALLETVCHFAIDFGKCEGRYGLHADQLFHIACKGVWVILIMQGIA